MPVAYANGRQQDAAKSEPIVCTYGDKTGPTTVALVGDSKVLQWLPAVQKTAERHTEGAHRHQVGVRLD